MRSLKKMILDDVKSECLTVIGKSIDHVAIYRFVVRNTWYKIEAGEIPFIVMRQINNEK